jgi:hypothetical protein
MRRIIVLLMVAAVVAVMVLLAAGGPAMARTIPEATCNEGTETAHEFAVSEGGEGPGEAGPHVGTHTATAHEFGIPCEP